MIYSPLYKAKSYSTQDTLPHKNLQSRIVTGPQPTTQNEALPGINPDAIPFPTPELLKPKPRCKMLPLELCGTVSEPHSVMPKSLLILSPSILSVWIAAVLSEELRGKSIIAARMAHLAMSP